MAGAYSAPSGLGRWFGIVPEALPLAIVCRRVAAGEEGCAAPTGLLARRPVVPGL